MPDPVLLVPIFYYKRLFYYKRSFWAAMYSSKENVQMLLFIVVNALSYTKLVHRHATLNERNKYIN